MNPEIKIEEEKVNIKGKEKVIEKWVLHGSVIHDSTKCKHEFVQKTASTVECANCGLGLFGRTSGGKLV